MLSFFLFTTDRQTGGRIECTIRRGKGIDDSELVMR